jgi:uncharacterized protein DUF6600
MRLRKWMVVTALLLPLLGAAPAVGAGPEQGGPTPPRLSFIDGEVSFWRPGAEDWAPAKANMPLAPGDSLYTGEKANVELQLGPRDFVRGGAGTQIGLETLEQNFVQLKVTVGHAAVDLRDNAGRTIEVDTPQGAFTIDHPGYYRVEVDENQTTFVNRRDGRASVIPAGGEQTDVGPDRQVVLAGNDEHADITTGGAPAEDDWDRWNIQRTDGLGEQPRSARYLPRGVAGADDLDRYGSWHDEPQYGPMWTPSAVPPDWAPYTTGRWVWDPYYGWTWVDDAPWGWAPFHYGRWVSVGPGWGWVPGPVAVAPIYSPALVAFFGSPGVGVSVSIGFPFVSWVALGFGEPLIPWWGHPGFIGTAWWGGWGGPRIVNNVVIQRNTYVNVRNVTVYRNMSVHNAVVAVNRDHFGRHDSQHIRLSAADVRQLRPVHGNLGVHPAPQSLVPAQGRALRPPDAVRARPVVATRSPQDPSPHLRASGLNAGPAHVPPPRVVEPKGAQHGGPRGGGPAMTHERTTPPPPPHAGAPTHAAGGPGHGPGAPGGAPRAVPPGASERPGQAAPHGGGVEHPRGGGAPEAPSAPHGGNAPRETERRPAPSGEAPPERPHAPAAPASPPATQPAQPREQRIPPPSAHPAPAPGYPRPGYSRPASAAPRPAPSATHPAAPPPRQQHPTHQGSAAPQLPPRHGVASSAFGGHSRHPGGRG